MASLYYDASCLLHQLSLVEARRQTLSRMPNVHRHPIPSPEPFHTGAIDRYREPGTEVYFEYRCYEGHDSIDAELWYRSHQRTSVVACVNADQYGDLTFDDRRDSGCPLVYRIRFTDGFEADALEEELLDSESSYERPDPPIRKGIE